MSDFRKPSPARRDRHRQSRAPGAPVGVSDIALQFVPGGSVCAVAPIAGGHIHESFRVDLESSEGPRRLVLQRINTRVFRQPMLVQENLERLTAHVARRLEAAGAEGIERRVVRPVPAGDGRSWWVDAYGRYWRAFERIEGVFQLEAAGTPEQARAAAHAFGEFQTWLADLPEPPLHETIPGFHHTPARFAALTRAANADLHGRVADVRDELAWVFGERHVAAILLERHRTGDLPRRIVHNDAKIANVLFDRATRAPLAVVDLDTVMPGLAPWDFGDMVRSMACRAAEDERDLSRVTIDQALFEAIAEGYLEAARGWITREEREALLLAAQVITIEQAVRFLTDYLEGDTYYRVTRPGQNVDRARAQIALARDLLEHEAALRTAIDRVWASL